MTSVALRSPNWMTIDLRVLRSNYAELLRRAGGRGVAVAVKADAYGHGAVEVARALADCGCPSVWTGHVDEALAIRHAVPGIEVDLFAGYLPDDIPALLAEGLRPTVVDLAGAAAAARHGGSVNVKVDAGLGRLGVPLQNAARVIGQMAAMPGLQIAGVYTHLPFADVGGRAWSAERSLGFGRLLAELAAAGIRPAFTQLWGSAGLFAGQPDPSNAVCIGHMMYGLAPSAEFEPSADGLGPVIAELGSRLIHVVDHPEGSVAMPGGYAHRGAARTGVIPLGVSDGMRRFGAVGEPSVLVRGRRVPAIGTSLEHTIVDLSDIAEVQVGDPVLLVGHVDGERITLAEWATWMRCSELDAALGFAGRINRRYVDLPSP